MSDYGDDEDPYKVERGYKTDSYILAVQGSQVQNLSLDQPSTSFQSGGRHQRKAKTQIPLLAQSDSKVRSSGREVYEAYIADAGTDIRVEKRPITGPKPQVQEPVTYGTLTSKRQLDRYRKDRCWSTCRWLLMLLILLICLSLLLFAIYFSYLTPRCNKVDSAWWKNSVVYEIWTPSFRDSNADGYGDFAGIEEKLKYLRRLGIDVIYPRPFLQSDDTSGLAILDWTDVQDRNGALQDAINLIKAVHKQRMKIIIDFPIAATSLQHEWFKRSSRASLQENADFATYYFWKRNLQANGFVSYFNETENLYYHVEDHPEWAVLNYGAPNITRKIKRAIDFWVEHGIDGFHIRFADYLSRTIDGKHPNWRGVVSALTDLNDHVSYYLNMSLNEELKEKRLFFFASMSHIGESDKIKLGEKALMTGVLNSELLRIAVGNKICEKHPDNVADCSNEVIGDILQFHNERRDRVWPLWQFSNAETERLASRTSSRLQAELLLMVELLLPGTPILFYGDELGVQNAQDAEFSQRTAMAWNSDSTSGFSNADLLKWSTKLPTDWKAINFETQYGDHQSHLRVIKRVIQLRKLYRETLTNGRTYISKSYRNSFTLCRFNQQGNQTMGEVIVLAVNFGSRSIDVNLNDLPPYNVITSIAVNPGDPPLFYKQCEIDRSVEFKAEVIAVSSAVIRQGTYYPHQRINIAPGTVRLGADQAIIFKFNIDSSYYRRRCPR